jgi:hypothetical protein
MLFKKDLLGAAMGTPDFSPDEASPEVDQEGNAVVSGGGLVGPDDDAGPGRPPRSRPLHRPRSDPPGGERVLDPPEAVVVTLRLLADERETVMTTCLGHADLLRDDAEEDPDRAVRRRESVWASFPSGLSESQADPSMA